MVSRHGAALVGLETEVAGQYGNAVNNPQRGIVGIDGAITANTDLGKGTGLTGASGNGHTGELAGKCLVDGSHRGCGEGFTLDGRNRTGDGLTLDRTVGHDDRLFEELGIRLEDHIDNLLSTNGYFHRFVAKAAEYKRSVSGDGNCVATRCIGHRIHGGTALKLHCSSGYSLAA